jgi:flagellin
MTAQIRGLNQAVRNANDAISLLQTADGAMIEQTNMMQRMRELAVQAANDTVTPTQKEYLDNEFQALMTEIDRIGGQTQWNGEDLLLATGGTAGTYTFQIGAGDTAINTIDVAIGKATTLGIFSDLAGEDISTTANATSAITALDLAIEEGSLQRSVLGAAINQLTYAADNMTNISMNTSASRSRIEDTDYATASTELARTQIIQQAATAMLAQANQSPQSVLALLK